MRLMLICIVKMDVVRFLSVLANENIFGFINSMLDQMCGMEQIRKGRCDFNRNARAAV